jgi:hypothetical protein
MTAYFVSTRARYVVVEAETEAQARELGQAALHELYADLRERLGREVPIEIHTVRPASTDEIDMTTWHNEMVAREANDVRNASWGVWCIRGAASVLGAAADWAKVDGRVFTGSKAAAEALAKDWNGSAGGSALSYCARPFDSDA